MVLSGFGTPGVIDTGNDERRHLDDGCRVGRGTSALVHPRSSTGPCSPYPGTVLIEPKQVDRPFPSHTFFTLRRPVAKRSDSFLAKQNGIKR